eukprot:1276219-Ditylum_brightwellii.AAC.1
MPGEETLQSKCAYEKVAAAHGVHVKDITQIMGGLERKLLGLPVMSKVRKLPLVVWEHINRMELLKIGLSF